MSAVILIQEKNDTARFREWRGSGGVPEITTVKVDTAVSVIVTVDTVQTVLAANGSRNKMILHNLATQAVYVKLGAGASTTDFSFILQPCTVSRDGKGGTFIDDCYAGIVTAVAASGTGIQVVATEY